MNNTPYLDFYQKLDVSPVAQDITNLAKHFQRRDSLYRFLGIIPSYVKGRHIIEFGPGSGHNALYTASLDPARYVLVDGNPRGIAEMRANFSSHFGEHPNLTIIESRFENFPNDEQFDLVLAEGFLPHVADPPALLRRLSTFVKPGGVLVITTVTPVSILSENLRRLMRTSLIAPTAPAEDQIKILQPILCPHLETLRGMSRSHDHWLIDNIVQPVSHAGLLSIPKAIATLDGDFDAYGVSPAFLTDLRWYKDVHGSERGFNTQMINSYNRRVAAFVDYRFDPPEHEEEIGQIIEEKCAEVWRYMNAVESEGKVRLASEVAPILRDLAKYLEKIVPDTAIALSEAENYFAGHMSFSSMKAFPSFWGRGQQYLSMVRRHSWPRFTNTQQGG